MARATLAGAAHRERSRVLPGLVLLVGVLVPPACGGSSGSVSESGEPVRFKASDGVQLAGSVFGDGQVAVILAHMGRPGDTQADWYSLARPLAERGYLVLTYNRRGVCPAPGRQCSGGFNDLAATWKDVVGASGFVRSRGATTVALVGASIGAMAALHVSATHRVEAAAVVEIGGVNHSSGYDFSRVQLLRLEGAKLFVSSAGDVYGGAAAAREWHRWAREPKQLEILPGAEHGTDMLLEGQATARPLKKLVLDFLFRTVPPSR